MRGLLRRIAYWLRAARLEAELAEELETHRQMAQARLEESGASRTDAEAASRRALGNVTLAREDARAIWIQPWIESVRQDVTYALRAFRRAPGFAAAIVLVTALGIGAAAGVFGLVDSLVLRSLPVHEPDRLVWFKSPSFSYPIFREVHARGAHIFSGLFAWDIDRLNVEWNGEIEPADVLTVSGDFYSTLGVRPALGRTFDDRDDRIGGGADGLVAMISYACWQRRFGSDPTIAGRTLRLDRRPFTIVGVTPPGFFGVAAGLAPEITIPLTSLQSPDALRTPSSSWVHLMGRLRDGVTLEQADLGVGAFWPAVLEATTDPRLPADQRARFLGRQTGLESGRAGYSRVRNQFEEPLWMLAGLVALLLAVACASTANLLLARGMLRHREIAIRLAIGGSRSRVFRQMVTEAVVWTIPGAACGLLLAAWGAAGLVALMITREEPIVLDVATNWRTALFAMSLALVTAAGGAVFPALRATRLQPATSLKGTGLAGGVLLRRWSPGKSLVAAQVGLTVLLLVGAALFVRSLLRILSQDAGFERDSVLVLSTDPRAAGYHDDALAAFHDRLLDRLRSVGGVESASLSWYPPISDEDGAWTQSVEVDGIPIDQGDAREVYFNGLSPDYFRTMGIRILSGRDFDRQDNASAPRVVIINESLARRFFAGQNPLGRRITIGRDASRRNLEIVGTVADAKYRRLEEPRLSIAYLPYAQLAGVGARRNLFAEVRAGGRTGATLEALRREVRAMDPRVPLHIESVTERIRESLARERVVAILAVGIGAAALVLACAGLYGLLGYAVSQHTGEIGLRLALGAQRGAVLWMVLRECLTLAVLGTLAGLAASLALGRFIRSLLYQVDPADPLALTAAMLIMLIVAAIAGVLPAQRAARVDPAVALKGE